MSLAALSKSVTPALLVTAWAAILGSPVRAQSAEKPKAALFTASEFPRLAERGFEPPASGKLVIKIWTPTSQTWCLAKDGDRLNLSSEMKGDDLTPRWQELGSAEFKAGERVKVRVLGPADKEKNTKPEASKDEKKAKEKAKTEEKAKADDNPKPKAEKEAPPLPPALPAVMVVANDASYNPTPVLDLIRVRVDSTGPMGDPRRDRVRTNKEGADFQPPATAQAWRDRARALREQLLVTMGLWPMFPKTPLKPEFRGKLERDGYTIERVLLETFPGFTLGGNLYRPAGPVKEKRPGILCPHGHWEDGRVNPEVQQRCIRLAKLGCVVFMYDMVGYNDSKAFGHEFLNDRLRRWGLSLVTLQTWDSVRALDWLSSLPDVDPTRIGCTGESGGGTQTFLLTAIDDRVRVAAPVVMVSDWFQGGCVCENCAGLRLGTDNIEIAALTAPRPLKLVGATGDWTAKTMTKAYPTIERVFKLLGTPDRVSAEVFDFPHNYNQTSRNAVYPFLAHWLMGNHDAARTKEGEQKTEKPEDLQVFGGKKSDKDWVKTPRALEDDLIAALGREISALAPGDSSVRWESDRELLRTAHRVRVGLDNPPPASLLAAELRGVNRDGFRATHLSIGRKAVGENIPVLRLSPPRPNGKLTVITSPHGKAALVEADGKPVKLVQELLDRGESVVGFDPLYVGESSDPTTGVFRRPETVHYHTYNASLSADQMQDLATVIAWARSLPEIRAVNLVGHGRAGAQTLVARPRLEGIARTAVDLHDFSEGDGSGTWPADIDLPGLLQFGGLKAAAALCAPDPLWVMRPANSFERAWPEKAYALADTSQVLKIDAERPSPADLARWLDSGE